MKWNVHWSIGGTVGVHRGSVGPTHTHAGITYNSTDSDLKLYWPATITDPDHADLINSGSPAGWLHLKGAILKKNSRSSWQAGSQFEGWAETAEAWWRTEGGQLWEVEGEEEEEGGRQTLRPPSTLVTSKICRRLQGRAANEDQSEARVEAPPFLSVMKLNYPTDSFLCRRSGFFSSPVNSAGIVSVSTRRLMRQTLPVSWISIPLSLPAVNLRRWTFSFLRLFVLSFSPVFLSFILRSNLTCVSCDTHSGLRFTNFSFTQPPFFFAQPRGLFYFLTENSRLIVSHEQR